jgi:hypothetical protein
MAFDQTQKEKVVESLMAARRQGQIAEIKLRFQGKSDEAEKVWQINRRLSTEIDILIGQMMDAWLDDAERAIGRLLNVNANLEGAIAQIENQINVAQNVVKIIGLLDDTVAIAKKVVAGV